MKIIITLLLSTILLVTGCGKATVPHPGAINAFDSNMYDTLLTAQAAIEAAKAHINDFPAMRSELNTVIAAYNTTMTAYKTYHAAGTGNSAELGNQITALTASVAGLIKKMFPQPQASNKWLGVDMGYGKAYAWGTK